MSLYYCTFCAERIGEHEPDLVLEDLLTGRLRHYHAFCEKAALEIILEKPASYQLIVRHIEAEMN